MRLKMKSTLNIWLLSTAAGIRVDQQQQEDQQFIGNVFSAIGHAIMGSSKGSTQQPSQQFQLIQVKELSNNATVAP